MPVYANGGFAVSQLVENVVAGESSFVAIETKRRVAWLTAECGPKMNGRDLASRLLGASGASRPRPAKSAYF
jgi:hypothetical protein